MKRLPLLGLILALLLYGFSVSAEFIPKNAFKYKRFATATYKLVLGYDAPISAMASQIHWESAWRVSAKSPVGAQGLAQFLPSTAKDISSRHSELREGDPFNPKWAIRAQAVYMRTLLKQNTAVDDCEDLAFALAGYNGGRGWVLAEKDLAKDAGYDPFRWWGNVEKFNARSEEAYRENREYPRKILIRTQSLYRKWQMQPLMCQHLI